MELNVTSLLHEDPSGRTGRVLYQDGFYLILQYTTSKDMTRFIEMHTKKRRGQDVTDITSDDERDYWLSKVVGWEGLFHKHPDGTRFEIPYDPESPVVVQLTEQANVRLAALAQEKGRPFSPLTTEGYLRWLLSQMWDNFDTDFRTCIRQGCRDLDNFR